MTAPIDPDLFVLTARLRRAQPRNPDVLELCERAEKLAHERAAPASASAKAANKPSAANAAAVAVANAPNTPKRDRADYMRTYMRQRRAKQGETSP
jgi:hypothetical protein